MENYILDLLKNDEELEKEINQLTSYDLFLAMKEISASDQQRILSLLNDDKKANLFVELNFPEQKALIDVLVTANKKMILSKIKNDDLEYFFEELNEEDIDAYFSLLPVERQVIIKELLHYEADKVGSVMDTDFITVTEDMTIKSATHQVITTSKENDYIDTIYVVDEANHLIGSIELKNLIIARPDVDLKSIINYQLQSVSPNDFVNMAIKMVRDYDLPAVPVVTNGMLVGIITGDDILDEFMAEKEEDFAKMAMVSQEESTNPAFRALKRLPWLLISVVLNLLIVVFLKDFDEMLSIIPALVFFQPLILGMSGNIGTQSLAVTILGLNMNKLKSKKQKRKHIGREIIIGFVNSLILSVLSFLIVWLFLWVKGGSLVPMGSGAILTAISSFPIIGQAAMIGVTVGLAVFVSLLVAASLGVLTPLFMKMIKADPAIASGPIITTIIDLIGMLVYFAIAAALLLI